MPNKPFITRCFGLTLCIPCIAPLQGCMALPIVGLAASLAPAGNSGSSGDASYQVSADYDKTYTAVQTALAELARIGVSDRQSGMLQGQAGAAKSITIKVAHRSQGTAFKVEVVNTAGIYSMFDKGNEGKTIADRVSAILGISVTPTTVSVGVK